MAIFSNLAKGANNIGLDSKVHRQVGPLPVSKHAYAHKIFALPVHLPHGIVAAFLAEGRVINFDAGLTHFLFNIVFNRQTMAVPAGNIGRIKTTQGARLNHNIF